jgi:YbbR domain-containing protein
MTNPLKNLLTRNLGLKLASFLLALIVWLSMIGEEKNKSEKIITVPLEIHNRPELMMLVERPPQTVDVTVRASNRLLPEITAANVHVALDLSEASVAQIDYALNHNMVSLPPGGEVKEISPSQVRLKLELTEEISVTVEPDVIGTVAEDYKLISVTCIPPDVRIYGPESKISDRIKVKTIPIDLSEHTESTEMAVDLIIPDPEFLRLVDSTTKVLVRLVIEQPEVEEGEAPPEKKTPPAPKKKGP